MLKALLAFIATACSIQAHAATYAIDPNHTNVMFEIDHFISTNRGRFDRKEGVIEFDRQARTGRVELTIDTASVNSAIPAFNRTLAGKDFFDTEQFPNAKFVADRFSFDGERLAEVTGALTMLGKTQPVTLKARRFACMDNAMLKREVCGGDFEASISRSQWGMVWGIQRGFPDTVRLVVQVEAIKQ